jgi:hypothetical protein
MSAASAVAGFSVRKENTSASIAPLDWRLIAAFSGATVLIHFLTNGTYGYFRDELYFMACGEHLSWGYVDLPPMVAAIARFSRATMGDSLFAIRFFPALAGGATVALTGVFAWEFGGGRFAQFLAMLTALLTPHFLGLATILTMNAFDPIFWMGCVWALIRIIKSGDPRWWLMFGISAGLGLENKESIVFFGACVLLALVLTPQRGVMFNRWFLLGGLIAVVLAMPTAIWQALHHFPMYEELSKVRASDKNTPFTMLGYFAAQVVQMNPFAAPVWLAGLGFFLFAERAKAFRFFGFTYILLWITFVALRGKPYYLGPIYPVFLGAGAVSLEALGRGGIWRPVIRDALPAIVLITGILVSPNALPVLPVDTFIAYQRALQRHSGVGVPKNETSSLGDLPQFYADMFGWEEMTAAVAKIYRGLTPEQQRETAIYASNYGEAAAIDFFGPRYGLPKAISGHMAYYIWGPPKHPIKILIGIQGDEDGYHRAFANVQNASTFGTKYSMPNEHGSIYLCEDPKLDLKALWARTKLYQ